MYKALAEEFLKTISVPGKLKHQRGSMKSDNFILFFIATKETVLPKAISEELSITQARVTKVLNTLARDGFITRETDPIDRRRVIVKITDKGREKGLKEREIFINKAAKLFEALGEEDARQYVRIMGKIAQLHKNM